MKFIIIFVIAFLTKAEAASPLRTLRPDELAVREDVNLILKKARLTNIDFLLTQNNDGVAKIKCKKEKVLIEVSNEEICDQNLFMPLHSIWNLIRGWVLSE